MDASPRLDAAPPQARDVGSEIASLAGVLNAVTARLVDVVAHAISAGETDEAGMKTPAAWLAWRSGISPERAGQLVKLAKVRDRYPVLFAAFERGEVSVDQLTELVKAPEWAQSQVLAFAKIATVTRLRRMMRDEHFDGDPDVPTEELRTKEPEDRVGFGVRDGRWRLTANFDLDEGSEIQAALTEAKDRLFDDNPDVTWADALVDIARRSIDAVPSRARRDRYRTWLHLDTNGALATTDGWRIPESLTALLTCDVAIAPVWERDGVPFSVGRAQHIVPDRTRRIVERRDRGCRVPGCTADRFVEVHHIVHWDNGGPTDTWNLVCLCPKHHRMHHQRVLGIAGNADEPAGVTFTDARGSPIPSCCHPAPPGRLPDCERPFEHPPAGRMNYDWVGLGWAHPNALTRRREQAASWSDRAL